jgi:glycosyltransferase involved in cell wall biosynthesis
MANFGEGFGSLASIGYRQAERLVGRWTDAYMVVGRDLRERFREAGIAQPGRYHVIRTAIALDRFRAAAETGRRSARHGLRLPLGVPVVAYVGSLEERKGMRQLPSYLREVHEATGSDAKLVIAGEGQLRAELGAAVAKAGLAQSVEFLGFTERVPEVMVAADCVVLLSETEGLPQVLVQAAAARTPFVSYPVDGTAELLARGAAGTVVPFGDWAAAARATAGLLRAPSPAMIDLGDWELSVVRREYHNLYERYARAAEVRIVP